MTEALPHGILVVDKPKGRSSHDVVQTLRRALRTRAVGHAGTLDPMATGVLVLGVGEGTKLLHHLSGDDKTYLATVKLGAETSTLDAEGAVVGEAALPESLTLSLVAAAAASFVGEIVQRAPAVSAIKVDGVALHKRVRRGEEVDAPERSVVVRELEVLALRGDELDLRVHCGKGFYVRSLARDLALSLGTRGHLSALRRTQSGSFTLDDAVAYPELEDARRGDEEARGRLRARLLPPAAALRSVPMVRVDAQGVTDVRHGRALSAARITSGDLPAEGTALVGVLDAEARLIALGRCRAGVIEIKRGIFG